MAETLPDGWVMTTLGEVCAINPRPSGDELPPEETEVSFVPMASVEAETGRLDASQVRTLDSVRRGYTHFKENDVIFAKITPCMENGKIALATGLKNGLAYGSTEFLVFRPYEGVLPRFVLHFLLQQSFRNSAQQVMTGAVGHKRVPSKFLVTHSFPLPPTLEQERIVEKLDTMLSRVAAGEAAARRALDKIERYRAAVLNSAVTGELTRKWRKTNKPDETGAQLLQRLLKERRAHWEEVELKRLQATGKSPKDDKWRKRYKEPTPPNVDDIVNLPNDWTWASIDMIAELGSGISVSQSRTVKNPVEVPYLRVANVLRGTLDLSVIKTIRVNRDHLESFLLKNGDILFNEGGDRDKLGRGWIWEGQIPRCVHQNHVFRARLVNLSLVEAKFISHWGNTYGQQFFMRHGTQTTNLASINRTVLARLPVPIIPVAEQRVIIHEVERRLANADRLASTLKHQHERAADARQSLLHEAFSGTLVPQDPKDESASVLLDHIRAVRETEANKPKAMRMPKPKSAVTRRPLLDVLREHNQPMSSEALFRSSGYASLFSKSDEPQDVVDSFYKELRNLTEEPAKVAQIKDSNNRIALRAMP